MLDAERDVDRPVHDAGGRGTIASDGDTDSSAWLMKWYGVVVADSNSRPSMESTHPLV